MSENKKYTLNRLEAGELTRRLVTALSWTDDVVAVDLGEVDEIGNINIYVDSRLAATLRSFKEEA